MYEKMITVALSDNRLEKINSNCWNFVFRLWKAVNDVHHYFEYGLSIDSVNGFVLFI